MSVCPLAYLKNDMSKLFKYMLPAAVARSSSDVYIVFPVLWMMSYLPTVGDEKTTPTGSILKVTHQGAESGAKSDVYDGLDETCFDRQMATVTVLCMLVTCSKLFPSRNST